MKNKKAGSKIPIYGAQIGSAWYINLLSWANAYFDPLVS